MGILGNEMSDEAAKLGSKSTIGNLVVPTAPSTIKRKIHEKIISQWTKEWMSNPEWCRQTKCFYKKVDKKKTHSLLKYGKDVTSRFIRFITGHAFLRKQNAYVRYGPGSNQENIPFDEIKCRMCGESVEEPVHIIKECEAFWQERFQEFECIEWHPDKEWNVDQMIRFLNEIRVRNLEEEEETDN